VFGLIDPKPLPLPARAALRLARLLEKRTSDVAPSRLAAALTRLGPTYVKLGQFLATRPDVVGVALARDLESLQDNMAPFPQAAAVKVLRPGIERRFRADLDAFTFAARSAERFSAEARRLRLVEVVETLRRSVTVEMDLRLEAAALSEMAENTQNDPGFRVPM